MSLIERAAKRMEEIGKAAAKGSLETEAAVSNLQVDVSLVESVVRKVSLPDAAQPALQHAGSTLQGQPRTYGPNDERDNPADRSMRELHQPNPGSVRGRGASAPAAKPLAAGGARNAQRLAMDISKLAALGYLDPEEPESIIANEFRKIKRPLIQACQGKLPAPVANANRLMVTSAVPGEGKSFIALNLAFSIAMERDSTVLLIDADTTRRSLSELIGMGSDPGLLDVLAGKIRTADTLVRTSVDRLTILPAGQRQRHATELLASEAMEGLVEELASRYADRILIFDTPPLLGAPEPAVLATHMGQIMLVVEADKTTHKVLKSALATIESCPVVTAVLNKTTSAESSYYYYST